MARLINGTNNPAANLRANIIRDHAKDRLLLILTSALAILALLATRDLVLGQAADGVWLKLVERLAKPESSLVALTLVLVSICLGAFRKPGVESRIHRLKHLRHHIPLWCVALSASGVSLLVVFGNHAVREILGLPEWLPYIPTWLKVTLFGIFGCALLAHLVLWAYWGIAGRHLGKKRPGQRKLTSGVQIEPLGAPKGSADSMDPEAFLARLGSDEPVKLVSEDGFGTGSIARRIADRLREDVPTTHAVVGALGAGKSTLGEFLKNILEGADGRPKCRVIRIELWPFLTSDAALAGILNRIFDELEVEIGIGHLRTIPRQYLDALESFSGFWQSLSRSIRGTESNPSEILERIDRLATMLNLRLVVWIDDLERFAGDGPSSVGISAKEADRLSPIRALLHALGEQRSITVVVATTSLEAGFDWDKIARYIYEIPRMNPAATGKILRLFRERCLKGFLRPAEAKQLDRASLDAAWIDPTPPEIQKEFETLELGGSYREHAESIEKTGGFLTTPQAMALICQTPRALKQALRRADAYWQDDRMRGEFQFEQMLALYLLRDGCPKGFAIFRDHWSRLSSGGRQGESRLYLARSSFDDLIKKEGASVDGDRLLTSDLRLEALIEGLGSMEDKSGIRFIASLWRSDLEKSTKVAVQQIAEFVLKGTEKVGPQGFSASDGRGELYWKMFLEEVSLPYEDSDQVFMRRVLGASAEELAKLASKQVSGKALLDYEFALRPNLQGFLLAMVQQNVHAERTLPELQIAYRWEKDLFALLRNVYQSGRMTWNFREEFEQAMYLAIKSDPSLAARVERAFLDPQKFQGWFDSDRNYERMSERIRDQFREVYSSKVDEFVSKVAIPSTLKQLCFGLDSRNQLRDPDLKDISGWYPPFFREILQRMEGNEDVRIKMLPQIAIVLVSGNPPEFRSELANFLFGETDSLFKLVLVGEAPDMEGDPSMAVFFRAAQTSQDSPSGSTIREFSPQSL
jgi:hypothetical protein